MHHKNECVQMNVSGWCKRSIEFLLKLPPHEIDISTNYLFPLLNVQFGGKCYIIFNISSNKEQMYQDKYKEIKLPLKHKIPDLQTLPTLWKKCKSGLN